MDGVEPAQKQVTVFEALRLLPSSEDADDDNPSAPESSEQSQKPQKKKTKSKKKSKAAAKPRTLTGGSSSSGTLPPLQTPAQRLASPPGSPTPEGHTIPKGRIASAFAHPSLYDVLAEDEVVEPEPTPFPPHDTVTLMPPFSSDFWRVYGNKLRVFGTVEGVCDLNPERPFSIV